MTLEIVRLNHEHLGELLKTAPDLLSRDLHRAYFSNGSAALCLLADGVPVFAGGIVNLMWHRGEAWILPTPFFRKHVKTCLRSLRDNLPILAVNCGFKRIQATCAQGVSAKLFQHLGFEFEGRLKRFGPNGENCEMWARIMGEA